MTDSKTVVEDLAVWLTAVWDEEERLAERQLEALESDRIAYDTDYPSGLIGDGPAAFTLARIAADRKILALHGVAWNAEVCTVCHHLTDDDLHVDHDPWPCATVRALAEPHADKPGFRSEWLVERQGVER